MPAAASHVCPDCKGTGVYVGLQTVELCRRCAGGGLVTCEGEPYYQLPLQRVRLGLLPSDVLDQCDYGALDGA